MQQDLQQALLLPSSDLPTSLPARPGRSHVPLSETERPSLGGPRLTPPTIMAGRSPEPPSSGGSAMTAKTTVALRNLEVRGCVCVCVYARVRVCARVCMSLTHTHTPTSTPPHHHRTQRTLSGNVLAFNIFASTGNQSASTALGRSGPLKFLM